MRNRIALLLTILAISMPVVGAAQTLWDSWEDPTPTWSVVSSSGSATRVGSEIYGSCAYVPTPGNTPAPIPPTNGTYMGRLECSTCFSGESVTVRYTLPVPVDASSVTYIVLDVYSCGRDREIGIQMRDSGTGVYPPNPSSAACKGGAVTAGGVTIGTVLQNQWDTLYLTVPVAVTLSDIASVDFIFAGDGNSYSELDGTVYFDNLRIMPANPCMPTPTTHLHLHPDPHHLSGRVGQYLYADAYLHPVLLD